MERNYRLFYTFLLVCVGTVALDVTIQTFKESPGLYYDHLGEAQLYNTEWKIVTYINLQDADENFRNVKDYAQMSIDFCKKHIDTFWVNHTDCIKDIPHTYRQIQEIDNLRTLVRQLTKNEDDPIQSRYKRGVFNFIGGISKILFGTLDNEDANYYSDKISSLEKEQMEFLRLSREQITVVKSTLRSLNSTLLAVSDNERILSKGLEDMAKHVNEQDEQVKRMFTASSIMLTVNEHSMQLNRAIDECRREFEILIDAIMNSQKGVLQPQIITPAQIMKLMKASQADMPPELSLPLPLSAAYHHLVLRIIDLDVFFKGDFLVYIIRLPLTNSVNYNLYHVLPLPIQLRNTESKFIFLLPDREYILMDTAKRYFARLRADELIKCKSISNRHRVCKQTQPLQLTHLDDECEAQMLQAVRTIPSTCSQRIAELNQTIWTQLDNNEWLFVAPKPEVLTVLCSKHEPSDVTLVGTGKLKLNNLCKGYGSRILIQTQITISTNNTDVDIIPRLPLNFDCCEVQGRNFSLNNIHLNLPLTNVIHHLDDLKVANHKVEEVEKLIEEQNWKLRHSNMDYHLSFLSYVGMVTTTLTCFILFYCCCCKRCLKLCPNFSRWWKDNNPCTTIVFKPKIVNSIHSSRESLRHHNVRASMKSKNSDGEPAETTELVSIDPTNKQMIPSGKR